MPDKLTDESVSPSRRLSTGNPARLPRGSSRGPCARFAGQALPAINLLATGDQATGQGDYQKIVEAYSEVIK